MPRMIYDGSWIGERIHFRVVVQFETIPHPRLRLRRYAQDDKISKTVLSLKN